jgi:hypothetical protein
MILIPEIHIFDNIKTQTLIPKENKTDFPIYYHLFSCSKYCWRCKQSAVTA